MHSKRNKHQSRHQPSAGARPDPIRAQVQARPLAKPSAPVSQAIARGPAANDSKTLGDSPNLPPVGYALVEDGFYEIAPRDMVFMGGRHASWISARRAGEIGSMRRFSTAIAVARHAA